jgi:UDP-N-acetylmuramate dehydrogenase
MEVAMAELAQRFGARLHERYPLAALTSFRIGGPGDLVLEVEDEGELMAALAVASRHEVPSFVLGAGTNLLVSDRGIRGLVIRLGRGFSTISFDGLEVSAGAAARFSDLVYAALERGLGGLEYGEGIPGTVGGALIMNAGAFGGELAPVVTAVRGVTAAGQPRRLSPAEVNFGYRRSLLPGGFIVSGVEMRLLPGDRAALLAKAAELRARRAGRQPKELPNAGSVFKNPPGNFAGRLLEECGLKGERIGDAAFSERHANFIVNLGQARAADVRALIELARKRVEEQTGVRLEPEVRLVGEW